jgi:hypothetical protein
LQEDIQMRRQVALILLCLLLATLGVFGPLRAIDADSPSSGSFQPEPTVGLAQESPWLEPLAMPDPASAQRDGNQYDYIIGDVQPSTVYPNGICLSPGSSLYGLAEYYFHLRLPAIALYSLRIGFYGKDESLVPGEPTIGAFNWETNKWERWSEGWSEGWHWHTVDPTTGRFVVRADDLWSIHVAVRADFWLDTHVKYVRVECEYVPAVTPTPTNTPTPTPTPTNTPTPTPTPTSTPVVPWLQWAKPSAPLFAAPGGFQVRVIYGNIPVPAAFTSTLTGAAVFADGSQGLTDTVTIANGGYTLVLYSQPGSLTGDTFQVYVVLSGLSLLRSGTVPWQVYLPLIWKH